MKYLILFFIVPCTAVLVLNATDIEEVKLLTRQTDAWNIDQEIDQLGIDSIPHVLSEISQRDTDYATLRAVYLMSRKYNQYRSQLSLEQEQEIIDTIVSRIESSPGLLRSGSFCNSLIAIGHPSIYAVVKQYENSNHPEVEFQVSKMLEIHGEGMLPVTPEVIEKVEALITSEPAVEKSPEVTPIEVTEEATAESTNWLLWLIGALVVLGGLAVVVRRKS